MTDVLRGTFRYTGYECAWDHGRILQSEQRSRWFLDGGISSEIKEGRLLHNGRAT